MLQEFRAQWELLEKYLTPEARALVVFPPRFDAKDQNYHETQLNYLLAPERLDYALPVDGRLVKIAHDFRNVDRTSPGYFDLLRFTRPQAPESLRAYDYVLVWRDAEWRPDAGFAELERIPGGVLYRRKGP
jgi:hypothetical protein